MIFVVYELNLIYEINIAKSLQNKKCVTIFYNYNNKNHN